MLYSPAMLSYTLPEVSNEESNCPSKSNQIKKNSKDNGNEIMAQSLESNQAQGHAGIMKRTETECESRWSRCHRLQGGKITKESQLFVNRKGKDCLITKAIKITGLGHNFS